MSREELLKIAKPILFNTEMVQAILDDRKTVTRRVIKPKYSNTHFMFRTDKYGTEFVEMQNQVEGETFGKNPDGTTWHKLVGYIVPKQPYKVGDILYVRETFCKWMNGNYYYKAAPIPEDKRIREEVKWNPSIHMPKGAARIFLKVTNVRVEKLQDITEEQAEKEGIQGYSKDGHLYKYAASLDWWDEYHRKYISKINSGTAWQNMPRSLWVAFMYLWDSTVLKQNLDKYGWDANPWVWVIEFEKVEV